MKYDIAHPRPKSIRDKSAKTSSLLDDYIDKFKPTNLPAIKKERTPSQTAHLGPRASAFGLAFFPVKPDDFNKRLRILGQKKRGGKGIKGFCHK